MENNKDDSGDLILGIIFFILLLVVILVIAISMEI
jgi:hypothetical protein